MASPQQPAPRSILVVKPSSFGDVIHTLPAVHALKRTWPDARIHWVVNSEWLPILESNADLAAAIPFPRRQLRGLRAPIGFLHWSRSLRASELQGFDLALDFQGLLRSALISMASGARTRLGLDDAREGSRWFYHHCAAVRHLPHAVDRYLALAALAGADTSNPHFPLPAGDALPGLSADAVRGAVLLHPFARGGGKSLPVPLIDQTIRRLAPRPVLLVGHDHGDGTRWPANTLDLRNHTSIANLIWLLRQVAAAVSVDSGPMHLAAALPVPLLGLHTWSDPRRVGPWRPDAAVWKAGTLTTVAKLGRQPASWCEAPGRWNDQLPESISQWVESLECHQDRKI